MTGHRPEDDEVDQPSAPDLELLARLRTLYERTDPVPETLVEDSLVAVTVATLDAELAELTSAPLVGVRDDDPGAGAATFTGEEASLMVTASEVDRGRLTLDGWVTPGGATVDIHGGQAVHRVVAEPSGRFVAHDLPPGRMWFVVWPAGPDSDRRPLVTPAIEP